MAFGGATGGSGGEASVTVESLTPEAAGKFACTGMEYQAVSFQEVNEKRINEFEVPWQTMMSVFYGLMGTYGIVEGYKLNERSVAVAEKGVQLACDNFDFQKSQYAEVFKPIYTCAKANWERYTQCFYNDEKAYVEKAMADCEYTPDYKAVASRLNAAAQQGLTIAQNVKKRQRSPYACGQSRYDDLQFAHMSQRARMDAINRAYRQEDEKVQRMNELYWNRKTQAMAVVSQIRSNASGMLTGAGGVAAQGLNLLNSSLGQFGSAQGRLAQANSQQSDLWAGVSNGAFQTLGYNSFGRTPADYSQLDNTFGGTYSSGGQMQNLGGGAVGGVQTAQAQPTLSVQNFGGSQSGFNGGGGIAGINGLTGGRIGGFDGTSGAFF